MKRKNDFQSMMIEEMLENQLIDRKIHVVLVSNLLVREQVQEVVNLTINHKEI